MKFHLKQDEQPMLEDWKPLKTKSGSHKCFSCECCLHCVSKLSFHVNKVHFLNSSTSSTSSECIPYGHNSLPGLWWVYESSSGSITWCLYTSVGWCNKGFRWSGFDGILLILDPELNLFISITQIKLYFLSSEFWKKNDKQKLLIWSEL